SESDWAWVLGVNLWGVVHGIRVFGPLLVEQGEGHIVNTASMAGLLCGPMMGPYNASKHAVVAISETLSKDLQLHGSPVGVSVVCPGFVRTRIAEADRNRPSGPGQTEIGSAGFEFLKQLVDQGIPPEDVARRVVDAIRTNSFWVLTHPELKAAVEGHTQEILEERNPSAAFFA